MRHLCIVGACWLVVAGMVGALPAAVVANVSPAMLGEVRSHAASSQSAPQIPPSSAPQSPPQDPPQGHELQDELDRLRSLLQAPGADGKVQRETAVEHLLAMADPEAHRVLQQRLLNAEDPDAVRLLVLSALQRHLVGSSANLFGGAAAEVRRQILTGYLAVLAPLWHVDGDVTDDLATNPLRAAARQALQRVPARELAVAANVLLTTSDVDSQVDLMRCLADMQQILLAQTIAEHLEAPELAVRAGARHALRLLTYHAEDFESKAQFDAWYERCGSMRYVDLVERAARQGPRPLERLRAELAQARIDAAREVVRAHAFRTPGIDWAAIAGRTVVDDPAVLDACLELLQQALANEVPTEEAAVPRQAFCKALLQRYRRVSPEQGKRRSLLLEVAAYLLRPEETDLANEVVGLLLAELDEPTAEARLSALRGLRRFPGVETRTRLVRYAMQLLSQGGSERQQVLAVLTTLSSRAVPRWYAPQPGDADKPEWLALVAAACRSAPQLELRDTALGLAQTLDAKNLRVTDVFQVLIELARDTALDTKFRSSCVIHLQSWRNEASLAEAWVQEMLNLLADPVPELRQLAAESLARLPESVDAKRNDWLRTSIGRIGDRLVVEPSPAVLRALVYSLQVCGREPQMPEPAIGILNKVLFDLGDPVPAEQVFRLEPLLQALATVASDSRADRGQWIGAGNGLLKFDKRQSLRLVLQSHGAVDLAAEVNNSDPGVASRARQAMKFLIGAAALKSPKEAWTSSDDLQREARDVRAAFAALDTAGEPATADDPKLRLLRLEVELATGKYQEAATRGTAWLANPSVPMGPNKVVLTGEQRDRMRQLVAEAHLALGKPDAALRSMTERSTDTAPDGAVLDLQSRIARALFATDPTTAVALFERTLRATPNDDPIYRMRLLDWLQHRLRRDPAARDTIQKEAGQYAKLFQAADCPSDLRESFEQLRAAR